MCAIKTAPYSFLNAFKTRLNEKKRKKTHDVLCLSKCLALCAQLSPKLECREHKYTLFICLAAPQLTTASLFGIACYNILLSKAFSSFASLFLHKHHTQSAKKGSSLTSRRRQSQRRAIPPMKTNISIVREERNRLGQGVGGDRTYVFTAIALEGATFRSVPVFSGAKQFCSSSRRRRQRRPVRAPPLPRSPYHTPIQAHTHKELVDT